MYVGEGTTRCPRPERGRQKETWREERRGSDYTVMTEGTGAD